MTDQGSTGRYRCVVCRERAVKRRRRPSDGKFLAFCAEHVGVRFDGLPDRSYRGSSEVFRLRSKIASMASWHPDVDLTEEREALRFETLYSRVERILAESPPLSSEQRERLVRIVYGEVDPHA